MLASKGLIMIPNHITAEKVMNRETGRERCFFPSRLRKTDMTDMTDMGKTGKSYEFLPAPGWHGRHVNVAFWTPQHSLETRKNKPKTDSYTRTMTLTRLNIASGKEHDFRDFSC